MKRRISAILLCLALLVGLLPTTALAAVTDSWDLKVHVSENDKVKYGEQNTLEVGFGVQSDNLQLRNLQSVMVAVDLTVFDLISKSGNVMTDKEFGDLKTTEYTEGAGKYVYFVNKFYSENEEADVNWTTKVYFAKSEVGKIGYVKIEPAQGQDACSVTTEMILSSMLLGFKAGKSKADLKPDSIRIATLEEANKLSNEVVAILTDGNENTQYYGFNPASGYTALKNNPAVVWADGLLPGTTYTVSFNANGGSGSMTDVTEVSGTYTLPACGFTAPEGKQFKGWATSADGTVIEEATIAVTGNITLYAIWENIPVVTHTVSFNSNGGSGSMDDVTGVSGTYTLPACGFTAPTGKQFKGWATSASGAVIAGTSIEVTADTTLYAVWEDIPSGTGTGTGTGTGVTTYAITVKSAKNGDVTASHKTASKGTTVTLTVDPDKGYVLDTLTVLDGKDKEIKLTEKNGKYTFTMPASKVTVEAMFKAAGNNPFTDVPAGSYYEDAVIWAVDKGITTSTSATTFNPNGICTRAQAVTFLWRAAGSPAAKSGAMPFADVKAGSYYYDAVLWAVEQGITKGTSETMFSPDATCTRAQIVTFLWRSQKSPAAGTANPFADVKAGAYYADAVLWAVKEDVTKGTTNTTFSPDATCTRAQIVTFIYRGVK